MIHCVIFCSAGASAGGPGDCQIIVASTASILSDTDTKFQQLLAFNLLEYDRIHAEAKSNNLSVDEFKQLLEATGFYITHNQIWIDFFTSIAQAVGLSIDEVYVPILTDGIHHYPLTCISQQLFVTYHMQFLANMETSQRRIDELLNAYNLEISSSSSPSS